MLAHREHASRIQRDHPDAHREANRRWREANPLYLKIWREANPGYGSWRGMINRCTKPAHIRFEHWGGRGVTICDRWLGSFEAFIEDMGPPPSPQHSIDRIDNDGDYVPENCRWATPSEQRANQRDPRR